MSEKNNSSSNSFSAMFRSVFSVFTENEEENFLEQEQKDFSLEQKPLYKNINSAHNSYLDFELLRKCFQDRIERRKERQQQWIELEKSRQLLELQKNVLEDVVSVASVEPNLEAESSFFEGQKNIDGQYNLPSLQLLVEENNTSQIQSLEEIEEKRRIIQETLDSFGIDAEVGKATYGPRVTLFEVTVARGVRVESVLSLSNNLAMDLSAISLRILAPVPGQSYIGLEVPNRTSQVIYLRRLLSSHVFQHSTLALPLALGRNICNEDVILDLAKAPHLLIAGATGSGKSVCLNVILMSLLFKFNPNELRLILIDPKVVEFSVYNSLPHLICPVITDPQNVALALRWVIREMEHRYKVLAQVGARNLASFNSRQKSDIIILDEKGEPIPEKFPYLVVIIDELADIMMTVKSEVETSLARIAQLSRAVGIHTIIATQRPSVNVITGVIKANFPSRIAFQVSSQIDSQTIIGGKGAESLLGRGDMLFFNGGAIKPERLQCPMVDDEEIQQVVNFVSSQAIQQFDDSVLSKTEDGNSNMMGNEKIVSDNEDPLISEAIEIIMRDRRATTSYLQRRLRIGYNKAASLIEELERRGVVGPQIGANPREILIDEPGDY